MHSLCTHYALYRYTAWYTWHGPSLSPRWDLPPVSIELYDHQHDDGLSFDDDSEAVNLALDGEYSTYLHELDGQLRVAFKAPRESAAL
jgi:hypothetical protein